jgi:hypothetical protein
MLNSHTSITHISLLVGFKIAHKKTQYIEYWVKFASRNVYAFLDMLTEELPTTINSLINTCINESLNPKRFH